MIIVKVTYTVNPDFLYKNRENIKLFMLDFKKLNTNNFQYHVYLCEDEKTFVHLSHYKDETIQKQLLETASFLTFQKERDESKLELDPTIETMHLVSAASSMF
ncbi:hypothetical protein EV196_103130 [Mariniflexile fucanivorans]|uniref:Quinol monooxygenase YgiN n=1 Tax=Mariniflexile fucanivorans TaxID=264023 RepID=A0A4V2QE50_9FLAO|nr:hypothetical protein [Mariniflexile fucanivorans]TCL66717.1 hypothetical protein EV196_103130 [Mariniflexile fucanivorans]